MAMAEYILSPRGVIKVSQLVLVVITLGCWFGLGTTQRDFITGTVFLAFFSAMAVFTQNMILGPARVLEILLSGVICLFFIISGIVVLVEASKDPVGATCGAFCFFTCIAYGIDIFFAFRIETE